MINFFAKKHLLLPLFSFLIFTCTSSKEGISIIYLFDTSGSYYKTAFPHSVDLAEKLFYEISDSKEGINEKPQIHQVGTIDKQSVQIGSNCYIKLKEINLFDKKNKHPDLTECLNKIRESKRSQYTDLDGALLTASQSMQTAGLYGKGIVLFSDLHEDVPNPKTFDYDLTETSIFVVYELSREQIRNPGMFEKDKNNLVKKLTNHGVNPEDILFRNLKSLVTSPNEIVSFFRKSFKNNQ